MPTGAARAVVTKRRGVVAPWSPAQLVGDNPAFRNTNVTTTPVNFPNWPGANLFTIWGKTNNLSVLTAWYNLINVRSAADPPTGAPSLLLQRDNLNAYPRIFMKSDSLGNSFPTEPLFDLCDGNSHIWAMVFRPLAGTMGYWMDSSTQLASDTFTIANNWINASADGVIFDRLGSYSSAWEACGCTFADVAAEGQMGDLMNYLAGL